jgi:hypothetical protein
MRISAVVVAVLLMVAVGALALGYRTAPRVARPDPIRLVDGVPVGGHGVGS